MGKKKKNADLKLESKKIGFSMKRSETPKTISPMLAILVEEVPKQGEWIFEIKWDGYRAISICQNNKINLISRNNKSFNDKYYPLIEALKKLNLNAVLDGEIVVLNEQGFTNFGALQNWRSEADGELVYYVFDLLYLNGTNLMDQPLKKRRELLKKSYLNQTLYAKVKRLKPPPNNFCTLQKKWV